MYKIIDILNHEKNIVAEIIDKKIWFKINHEVFSYDLIELAQSQTSKSKSKLKSTDKILAPMPGKITKVFVTQKQIVKKGQPLLVMEAMKMEYTMKSDIDAEVESLFIKTNDQVPLGHLLIQLKEIK